VVSIPRRLSREGEQVSLVTRQLWVRMHMELPGDTAALPVPTERRCNLGIQSWKALLLIRITQNGRRPTPYGAHRNWESNLIPTN